MRNYVYREQEYTKHKNTNRKSNEDLLKEYLAKGGEIKRKEVKITDHKFGEAYYFTVKSKLNKKIK